ncbi:MAG: Unknown protein, partial [uncultured Aureispira sp.]
DLKSNKMLSRFDILLDKKLLSCTQIIFKRRIKYQKHKQQKFDIVKSIVFFNYLVTGFI